MHRQGSEMTNVPEPSSHAAHDLVLIAAHAAGDTDGAERDRATALIGACDECARLHDDLLVLSTAVADLPAPARPRDFRLTEEQAASLRPTGWRGALAALAGPRFSFATPLGTAMATLGLVGLLLAGPGLPILGPSTASDMALAPTMDQAAPEAAAGAAAPSPALEAGSPVAGEELAPVAPAPEGSPDTAAGGYAAESPGDGASPPGAGTGSDTANVAPGESTERNVTRSNSAAAASPTGMWLVAGTTLVLLAGVLLVGLRLIARRAG